MPAARVLLILFTMTFSDVGLSSNDLITRLYLDFAGRRPSVAEQSFYLGKLKNAETPVEKRAVIKDLLLTDLMDGVFFKRRLKNYFNGLFGVDVRHGYILPVCSESLNSGCIKPDEALDFRDEMAMMIAMIIAEDDAGHDFRAVLNTDYTVMTPQMAKFLVENTPVREKIGYANIDISRLVKIAAKASSDWFFIDRDTTDLGMPTGTGGHLEKHAGILSTPAYLNRARTHLSRANYLYSWFMCREVDQINAPENFEPKLALRAPCTGCHAVLEPAGSFFVHWRAGLVPENTSADWLLDGVERLDEGGLPLVNNGKIPADFLDPKSPHSRKVSGEFRGKSGMGARSLGEITVSQIDFPNCAAKHAWQFVLGRAPDESEAGWPRILGAGLAERYQWDLREVMIDIVLSKAYAE